MNTAGPKCAEWNGRLVGSTFDVFGTPDDIVNLTLRKLYATLWKSWTLAETMDNELGRRFEKARNAAPHARLS